MNTLSSLLDYLRDTRQKKALASTIAGQTTVEGCLSAIDNKSLMEAGTSGGWYYRKWNDGTAECWGQFTNTMTGWKAWGNQYESNVSIAASYPSNLFIDAPIVQTKICGSGTAGFAENIGVGTKTATPTVYLVRPNAPTIPSGGTTLYADFYAIGRWK